MAASPPEVVIRLRGISNRFGRQVVHDGLDMEVHRGEIFGIVGGSGSGKSVLLRTILGLQVPRAGSVEIGGRDLTRVHGRELRQVKRGYGVTFQHGALFSSLTVAENVELPLREALRLPDEVLAGLADLKVRLVGLPPDAGAKYPAQLSGGMVKRAALARALALDPPLLFLDEPTSGLDPIAANAFDELLLYLQASLRLTVVMVTHDLDSIHRTCNRVGVIVDRTMITDTLAGIVDNPHPWIQEYFRGPRGHLAALAATRAPGGDR
jgi:phospholipid/cholesterol/gamma-HCH transport system ATP-binding protein